MIKNRGQTTFFKNVVCPLFFSVFAKIKDAKTLNFKGYPALSG